MKRRTFFQSTVAASLMANPLGQVLAKGETLPKTPRDYEGPYYPVGPRNKTNDLIIGDPRDKVLRFHGTVVDIHGQPFKGALVDIWHTDPLGRYKHPKDQSDGERWQDFLYWGETLTSGSGAFEFRTYVPGHYGRRPPHIHYKVWHERKRILTSQVYFKELGGTQGASLSPTERDLQTVTLDPNEDGLTSYMRVVI